MAWLSFVRLDQTSICVFLIIIAVSFLWVYVSVVRGKAEQPNLNILYQKRPSQQVGNKRAQKNKGKSKHMPSPRSATKTAVALTVEPVTPLQQKENLTSHVKKEIGKQQVLTKQQINSKKQAAKRKTQNLPKDSNKDDGKLGRKESAKEVQVDVQGEWQTQLSRPQLRARRQKQQKGKASGRQGIPGEGEGVVDSGDKERNEMLCRSTKKTSLRAEEETTKEQSRQNFPSDDGKGAIVGASEAVSDTCLARDEENLGGADNESNNLSPGQDSCVLPPPAATTIQDVEVALREAASCGLSSIKDGSCVSYSEATKPRIWGKTRIKNKLDDEGSSSSSSSSSNSSSSSSSSSSSVKEEPRAVSMECDSQEEEEEDWVVI